MKVYDVWRKGSETEAYVDSDGWCTAYADDLDDISGFMEDEFPGEDWIIIENELPF